MSRPVFLKILGPPVLFVDDEPVSLSRKKSMALLAYLAMEERIHARDSLATFFWPECAQDKARANLRSCLLDLTEHLKLRVLLSDRDHVSLLPGILKVDALQFREKTRHCPSHGLERACKQCAPVLIETAELPIGLFMEGFTLPGCKEFDDWQTFQGTMFLEAIVSMYRRLTTWHEGRENWKAAIECVRSWISTDPYDEEARRCLMRLLAKCGRWIASDESYREWASIAKNELGVRPDGETETLRNSILASRPHISTIPGMIGREDIESYIRERLSKHASGIYTITGPGGVGKTRLARAIFENSGTDYTDGSLFVDISTVRDPALVVSELAAALGISQRTSGNESIISRIISIIGSKRILFVLDNFEQVLGGAMALRRIASSCKRASFLVTSRISLGLDEELEFPLGPLEYPREPDRFRLEDAETYPAVRLLIERARSANPAFVVENTDVVFAASICLRLDGLPLAIELAASRLGSNSLKELDEMIAKSSKVLDSGGSEKPARHRSLNAAVDWSWNLLDKDEQQFLEALSVFSGGFDRAASESVCGNCRRGGDRRDLLGELVAWNLISRQELRGRSRFQMPEAIREFAAEHLSESKAYNSVHRLHANYYLKLAEALSPSLHQTGQRDCLFLMKLEHGNFLAAGDFFRECGDASRALALGDALEWYWYRSGRYSEGCIALDRFLTIGDSTQLPDLYGRALRAKAWLLLLSGDWVGAKDCYSKSAGILQAAEDSEGLARALSGLGAAERWLGEFESGVAHGKQALTIARKLGDSLQKAFALIWLYSNTGGEKIDEAQLDALKETLSLSRIAGDPWCEAHALQGLGDYLRINGDVEESIACYEESLRLFESVGEDWMLAWTVEGLGMAEFRAGRLDKAKSRLSASLDLFLKLGDRGDVAYLIGELGVILASGGEVAKGDLLLGSSFALLNDVTQSPGKRAQPRDIPSGLSIHFVEAESRNSTSWKRGLILGFDRAVQEAIRAIRPGDGSVYKDSNV